MLTPIAPQNHWPYAVTTGTSYTLGRGDGVLYCRNANNLTVTLPSAAEYAGQIFGVVKDADNAATVAVGSLVVLYLLGDKVWVQSDGSNWIVVVERLTPHFADISREAAQENIDDNSITKVLHDTTNSDVGGLVDIANSRIIIQRSGVYDIKAPAGIASGGDIIPLIQSVIRVNGSTVKVEQEVQNVTTANAVTTATDTIELTAGDVIDSALQFLGLDDTKNTLPGFCALKVAEIR